MNIERVKTKKRPVAATISLIILFSSIILIPMSSNAQIITKNLKNLRTKINNHPWSFRPGDSLSWAEPELAPEDAAGWIDNMDVQLAWTRYRDKDGNRPFRRFSKYFKKYKGYGWYRTSFALSSDEMKNKFNNRDLILRLGKIGQADAVYLNGQFIGSTGLKKSTPAGAVLDDSVLYYDKMRLYKIPRELLSLTKPNIVAVRVFAKYNIAPGLSHGKYYIASDQKIERSKFWDDFKKIFVIALSSLLGVFYLYWQFLFLKDDRATVYFALASFAMAVNTFTQSRIIYSILPNSLSIKKMEFISIIIFAHLVIEFFVHFVRIDTFASKIIRRIWEVFGIGCVIAVAAIPSLVLLRRFVFFGWGTSLALIMIYLVYIIIKGRRIPSISLVTTGFIGMLVLLINDLLVGFQYRWVKWEFSEKDYAFAFFGLMAAASIVTNMKQSREIIEKQKTEKKKLSRYFSPDVVDTILDGDITLGGEEKPIVTLFADIVGFTNFSEHKDAALVVGRLNELFTRVSQVIFKYEATLDKYIGDCVMAFWGAPRSSPLDAYHAVACAVEIQQVCDDIKKGLPANEKPFLLRIGINYGDAIAGNIGSRERMDYTVIGDAVNIASRIESTGIPGKVAISESVFNAAGGEKYIQYSETKEVSAKGKSQSLKIYIVDSILPREE